MAATRQMRGEQAESDDTRVTGFARRRSLEWFDRAVALGQDVAAGAEIGPYTLVERIGSGGFGEVWQARQERPVRRDVALKVVKLGMDTDEFVARFEAERQALVRMEHPGIARVIDAGSTRGGRPFMVMELVDGEPVNVFCERHGLDTRARLELLEGICRAVQHAHLKGVIHRDLKPSNVLVSIDDQGRPAAKVIDFGLAKAVERPLTEASLHTAAGQFMGTPAYVSPEQASGAGDNVDTRSDVYSLGVLAYELLVGAPPFDGEELVAGGVEAMCRIIREREPALPSARAADAPAKTTIRGLPRQSRRELDWIVMKALEKERERRYQSASAFADDISRFLRGEAVEAAAPSRRYRLRKFARRHRLPLAAAGAVALALVAGIVGTSWQARAASASARAERDARTEAELVSKFLSEVFASPDPDLDGRDVTVVEMLEKGVARARRDFAGSPGLLAKILRPVARSYLALSLPDQALPLLEELRPLTEGIDVNPTFRREVRSDIATCHEAAGRWDEAMRIREELVDELSDAPSDDPLRQLALNNLAASMQSAGRHRDAARVLAELVAVRERTLGRDHPMTLTAQGNLAISQYALGEVDEALRVRRRIADVARGTLPPGHPGTLRALHDLAISLSAAGEIKEAMVLEREVAEARERVLGPLHLETVSSWGNLAISCREAGDSKAALAIWDDVVARHEQAGRDGHPNALDARNQRAICRAETGELKSAIVEWRAMLGDFDRVLGPRHVETMMVLENLAAAYKETGDGGEMVKMAIEIGRRKFAE